MEWQRSPGAQPRKVHASFAPLPVSASKPVLSSLVGREPGVKQLFHTGYLRSPGNRDIYITILKSSKITIMKEQRK